MFYISFLFSKAWGPHGTEKYMDSLVRDCKVRGCSADLGVGGRIIQYSNSSEK